MEVCCFYIIKTTYMWTSLTTSSPGCFLPSPPVHRALVLIIHSKSKHQHGKKSLLFMGTIPLCDADIGVRLSLLNLARILGPRRTNLTHTGCRSSRVYLKLQGAACRDYAASTALSWSPGSRQVLSPPRVSHWLAPLLPPFPGSATRNPGVGGA